MTNQPFSIPALLILVAAIPLTLGLVPKNSLYGIRTAKTLSDDDIWYRSNRFGGFALMLSSAIYLLVAALYPIARPDYPDLSHWLLHLGVFVLPLIASVTLTLRYTRNL